MKKVLKWISLILGGLLVIVLLVIFSLYIKASMQFNKSYAVPVETITIPVDEPSIAHGKHLADYLCTECHGDDLGGKSAWIDLPGIAVISPPNLTSGKGSAIRNFTDQDWIRLLRHGVKPDGKSVFIMPSSVLYFMNDTDFADLLAFVKSTPSIDRELGKSVQLTFFGKVLYGAGAFGHLLQAPKINQTSRPSYFPKPEVDAAYGEYLVNINGCRGCHGAQLAGGKPSNPDSSLAPNLTPGGEVVVWTETEFIYAMRSGVVPSGRQLNPAFMPWQYKAKMSDDELKAIFMYLQSLPMLETSIQPAE